MNLFDFPCGVIAIILLQWIRPTVGLSYYGTLYTLVCNAVCFVTFCIQVSLACEFPWARKSVSWSEMPKYLIEVLAQH